MTAPAVRAPAQIHHVVNAPAAFNASADGCALASRVLTAVMFGDGPSAAHAILDAAGDAPGVAELRANLIRMGHNPPTVNGGE